MTLRVRQPAADDPPSLDDPKPLPDQLAAIADQPHIINRG
jgi:hypothetical protein